MPAALCRLRKPWQVEGFEARACARDRGDGVSQRQRAGVPAPHWPFHTTHESIRYPNSPRARYNPATRDAFDCGNSAGTV